MRFLNSAQKITIRKSVVIPATFQR